MLDSYTQVALRPLHNVLERTLRKIQTDFTFNHMGGVSYLKSLGGELFSIDLSNATDTVPVDLGLRLIQDTIDPTLIGDRDQFIKDVKSVMTERDFWYENQGHRYSTGQPMGAYGSFPLLAITNHLLLQMARVLSGFPVARHSYAIVGDDIVISGRKVAENYIRLLEALGIPVNHNKMVEGVRTFEFCRRIVRDGEVMSVPSWNVLHHSAKSGNPVPIVMLNQQYGIRQLTYPLLARIFERRSLRNMLALNPDLHLVGEPNVERIPYDVASHADRVLGVLDSIKKPPLNLVTDDPYLKRLNYEDNIRKTYASYMVKLCP